MLGIIMPNVQYYCPVLAVAVALCLFTQIEICKASSLVAIKGIFEFRTNIDQEDLANSSTNNNTTLVAEIETRVKVNLTQTLSLEEITVRIRKTDGLCQVYFTIKGDVQLVSAWLVLWANIQIVINKTPSPVLVLFESKGQRYKVDTDQVCDVRNVIMPCSDTEQCSVDGCIPRQYQVPTGILIVLGYAAAFILILLLIVLFCFYRVAYLNTKRNKSKAQSPQRSVGIENRAFWGNM